MPLAKPLECGVYGERVRRGLTAGHDAGEALKVQLAQASGAHQDVYVQRDREAARVGRPGDVLKRVAALHEDQPDVSPSR